MPREHFSKPRNFASKTEKEVEDYLLSLNFYDRIDQGGISKEELKRILVDNLEQYFGGVVSQDFIVLLGTKLSREFIGTIENDDLISATCLLEDLSFSVPKRNKKEKEKNIRLALETLQKEK